MIFTLLAFSAPVAMAMVTVFVAVTYAAFTIVGRVTGGDQTAAETRLDLLRRGKSSEEDEDDTSKKKNDALAAVLERATTPLEKTVTGSEEEMGKLREQLINAGFRHERAAVMFKALQLITAGVGLFLGGATGLFIDGFSTGLLYKSLGGLIVGFLGPKFILGSIGKKRKEKVFLGLPDALDLMVVCVEAGLGIDQALRKVAEEMLKSHKEIGEEFGIANQQLQFGRTRSEVLQALGFRSGVDDLKQLASILIQADKFGSSVATALRVQSDSMRTKRRQIAEEKAAKTAVKMIFPLVLFIFPGIFIVLVGPAGINMWRNFLNA